MLLNATNLILIFFLLLLGFIVFTDDRFKLNRKILAVCIIILACIFCQIINKAPYEIIKELFWYSLILNISFFFHTLICDRLFCYFLNKKKDYYAFIISRLSFSLSLSGINYFLINIRGSLNEQIFENELFPNYIINKLLIYINVLINIVLIININFIKIFKNYELIFIGIKKKNKIDLVIIIRLLFIFITFLCLSIILNIPRLYLIWLIFGIFEGYLILNRNYLNDGSMFKKLSFKDKIKFSYKQWNYTFYLIEYYNIKSEELNLIYNKPYHKFFVFDLYRFIYNPFLYEEFTEDFDDIQYIYKNNAFKQEILKPINSVYKFYTWEELILIYSGITNQIYIKDLKIIDINDENTNKVLFNLYVFLQFSYLTKRNFEFIKQYVPDISEVDYENLVKRIKIDLLIY